MKKYCITFALILIILLLTVAKTDNEEYLRIHIRANSNSSVDQSVKMCVKDEVVAFIAPKIEHCQSKAEVIDVLNEKTGELNSAIENALIKKGFYYGASTVICKEEFPTRIYDGLTLESGVYDAIIVKLGSGKGDNWWCVVYPPPCFTAEKPIYRSKIYDIISDFL